MLNKKTKDKKPIYLVLSNIKPEQIHQLIKMGPKIAPNILNILKAVMVVIKKPETWEGILAQLRDYMFVGKLMEISKNVITDE